VGDGSVHVRGTLGGECPLASPPPALCRGVCTSAFHLVQCVDAAVALCGPACTSAWPDVCVLPLRPSVRGAGVHARRRCCL